MLTNRRSSAGLAGVFLVQYATQLGLDRDRFQRELASHVHSDRVREHFMSGVRSGVNGTPIFFLNDERYDGPHELDAMLERTAAVANTPPPVKKSMATASSPAP